MTGADIIAALLRGDPAATAIVPAASTKLGRLPDGIGLPAYLVRVVSSTEQSVLAVRKGFRITERVAVTVRASSYRDQVAAMKAARACCHGRTGTIAGATAVSVRSAGRGPDVNGPANSFEQTHDFSVSFVDPD